MPFKAAFSTVFLCSLVFLFPFQNSAAATDLTCLKNGQGALPMMNEQVLKWKTGTPNQYKDRALIQGTSVRLLLLRKSHVQFEVRIGERARDVIEVIYNREFGDLPRIVPGMRVEACGDYITSFAPSGNYPASPSGAIIHWVHANNDEPNGKNHEDGFVILDGVRYGHHAERGFWLNNLTDWVLRPAYVGY